MSIVSRQVTRTVMSWLRKRIWNVCVTGHSSGLDSWPSHDCISNGKTPLEPNWKRLCPPWEHHNEFWKTPVTKDIARQFFSSFQWDVPHNRPQHSLYSLQRLLVLYPLGFPIAQRFKATDHFNETQHSILGCTVPRSGSPLGYETMVRGRRGCKGISMWVMQKTTRIPFQCSTARCWTRRHGLFLLMGGFVLCNKDG